MFKLFSLAYKNVLFIFLIGFSCNSFILIWHFVIFCFKEAPVVPCRKCRTEQFQPINILVTIHLLSSKELFWSNMILKILFFSLSNENITWKMISVQKKILWHKFSHSILAKFDPILMYDVWWLSPKNINSIEKPKEHFVKEHF